MTYHVPLRGLKKLMKDLWEIAEVSFTLIFVPAVLARMADVEWSDGNLFAPLTYMAIGAVSFFAGVTKVFRWSKTETSRGPSS